MCVRSCSNPNKESSPGGDAPPRLQNYTITIVQRQDVYSFETLSFQNLKFYMDIKTYNKDADGINRNH